MTSKESKNPAPQRHTIKPNPWRLDRKLADNSFLLSICLVLIMALLIALAVVPVLVANAASRTVQVAVIDPHGSIYSTHTERLLESSALVKITAESFILAAYTKDPDGLRYLDMLKAVASDEIVQGFQKYWQANEAGDFSQRHIHQSPEVGQIQVLSRDSEQVLVSVDGQLIRNGAVNGAPFIESPRFKITLTLHVSLSHTQSLNFPLQVVGANTQLGGKS